jgi:hypothetical protein
MDFLRDFRPSRSSEPSSGEPEGSPPRFEWKPSDEVVLGLADLSPERDASAVTPKGAA